MNDVILVFYINVGLLDQEEASEYIGRLSEQVNSKKPPGTPAWYYITTQGENRVECINPKFITDQSRVDAALAQLQSINDMFRQESFLLLNKPEKFYINKKNI